MKLTVLCKKMSHSVLNLPILLGHCKSPLADKCTCITKVLYYTKITQANFSLAKRYPWSQIKNTGITRLTNLPNSFMWY